MRKPIAQDRALTQPSGVLYFWDDRVLYMGPGLPATVHAHQAIQVCIPLSSKLRLRSGPPAPWREYSGAVIAANQPHESDLAVDVLATFWLDPGVGEARELMQCRSSQPITPFEEPQLAALLPQFLACWRERWEPSRAASLLDEAVRALTPSLDPNVEIDPRVARAAEIARSNRHRRRWLSGLAAAVSLSPSRLEHIFTSEMGIPLRRYLLWQRLRRAVQELADGSSVTQAAHSAGFSDAAHLSRTFRRMLGFTPSSAFRLHVSRIVQA